MESAARDIQNALKGTEVLVHRCKTCVEIKGEYNLKIAKLFHLKKLVRPENFGPYHVRLPSTV
jgi:hypothetical protein